MNFNYSYRAFLIASLLVGNLVLILVTVKLNKKELPIEKEIPIEFSEIIPEEEELALKEDFEKMKIETNRAYNEAEEFIREIENSRNEAIELEQLNLDQTNSKYDERSNKIDFNKAEQQLNDVKKKLENSSKKKTKKSNGISRKTTISYSLKDRKALHLPNPVYTCDASGKIVITIEVNRLGKIVRMDYNKTLSTTTNGCLIDAALAYAKETRFNADSSKEKQLGTISYHFPGQQ